MGHKDDVLKAKEQMMSRFNCDEVGESEERIGCKVDINEEELSVTLTLPVLFQSSDDKFELPERASPAMSPHL